MIIRETKTIGGAAFTYTHSDKGMMIERDGVLYEEAYDPIHIDREYTETEVPIPVQEEPQKEE